MTSTSLHELKARFGSVEKLHDAMAAWRQPAPSVAALNRWLSPSRPAEPSPMYRAYLDEFAAAQIAPTASTS